MHDARAHAHSPSLPPCLPPPSQPPTPLPPLYLFLSRSHTPQAWPARCGPPAPLHRRRLAAALFVLAVAAALFRYGPPPPPLHIDTYLHKYIRAYIYASIHTYERERETRGREKMKERQEGDEGGRARPRLLAVPAAAAGIRVLVAAAGAGLVRVATRTGRAVRDRAGGPPSDSEPAAPGTQTRIFMASRVPYLQCANARDSDTRGAAGGERTSDGGRARGAAAPRGWGTVRLDPNRSGGLLRPQSTGSISGGLSLS